MRVCVGVCVLECMLGCVCVRVPVVQACFRVHEKMRAREKEG